jgi:hypothetical protein
MIETADKLFERYCALPAEHERINFALKAPRLLWSKTVRALEARGLWHDARVRLVELDRVRSHLLTGPADYPIGLGPIEQLMAAGVPPALVIETCRSPDLQAIVAPPYLHKVAFHSANLARTDSWEAGAWLSRFATEAALAFEPGSPIEPGIGEVVLGFVATATFSLQQTLDETIFTQALAAAAALLQRAELANDRELIGLLCQSIGSLFSDIWIVAGRPQDDTPVNLEEWLARPRARRGLFEGLGPDGTIPGVDACLVTATAWFRRALPYRSGAARGLSYKAILQTEHFRGAVLGQSIDEAELQRLWGIAEELLVKHPDASVHLEVLASIRSRRRWPTAIVRPTLEPADQSLLAGIDAAFEAGENDARHDGHAEAIKRDLERALGHSLSEIPAEAMCDLERESHLSRTEGHAEAMRDLERALRHRLPWALYLRNFDHANEIRVLGEPITYEDENSEHTTVIMPQISYSLVDHKIMQLFGEGVIAVCDPKLNIAHRRTPIPMLSLGGANWLDVVGRLAQRCTRTVMLLDELTPGVQAELDLLRQFRAAERTLIVSGNAFRTGKAVLPEAVTASFPHVVDWIDFGHDENYHEMRYKAHRIIQPWLLRYVRANAAPVVQAWLGTSRAN